MNLDNEKYRTGLKVFATSSAKLISIIKKYRNDAISSIKNDIDSNNYVLKCSSTDLESYDLLIECYEELIKTGFEATIFENDEPQDIQLIKNWSASIETSEFIENDDSWIDD